MSDRKPSDKPIIGLAGGIGSGKSAVAGILADLGCAVIDADAQVQAELEQPQVIETLVSWWGPEILDPTGRIDRQRVADIAFSDPARQKRLEDLLHARIAVHRDALIDRYRRDPDLRAIVLDAPLLFEAGLDKLCDRVIFVDAPADVRARRVRRSRGWGPEELARREKKQWSLHLKRRRASDIVTNGSGIDALAAQVRAVFSQIISQVHNS